METRASISIGTLAAATGVPASTLRTWERRYGFPPSERTAGGHRVYHPAIVERVRQVGRALEQGHRPAHVLALDERELQALLGAVPLPALSEWLGPIRRFDGAALERSLRGAWNRRGALAFLTEDLPAILKTIGERWANNELDVGEEHFASEHVRAFLFQEWRGLSDRNAGSTVLVAGLPGERHDLGLHMVAAVVASLGRRVVFLGGDTPVPSIAEAARATEASHVLMSVAPTADRDATSEALGKLARELGSVPLGAGGAGAPSGRGWRTIPDLGRLPAFLEEVAGGKAR